MSALPAVRLRIPLFSSCADEAPWLEGSKAGALPTGVVSQVEGNTVRIHKQPGWLFGDVALLFNSQRSASVVATSDITLWALNRRAFSKV